MLSMQGLIIVHLQMFTDHQALWNTLHAVSKNMINWPETTTPFPGF